MDEREYHIDTCNTDMAIGILKRFDNAVNKKQQFLPIWQEVADLVLPMRGGFYNIDDYGSVMPYDTHPENSQHPIHDPALPLCQGQRPAECRARLQQLPLAADRHPLDPRHAGQYDGVNNTD